MRDSLMKLSAALLCVAATVALVATVGCSGKPSGFPKVKPLVVSVTDGGAPVEGVEIALIPSSVASGVVVGGTTDATGQCVVTTTFANVSEPGAPEGEFSATFRKEPDVGMPDLTPEKTADMSRGDIDKYYQERDAKIAAAPKIVAPKLTSVQTTPVKVKVPDVSELKVELSEYR